MPEQGGVSHISLKRWMVLDFEFADGARNFVQGGLPPRYAPVQHNALDDPEAELLMWKRWGVYAWLSILMCESFELEGWGYSGAINEARFQRERDLGLPPSPWDIPPLIAFSRDF